MLLSPRTAMMSLIAVPAALVAHLFASPASLGQDAAGRSQPKPPMQLQQPTFIAQQMEPFYPGERHVISRPMAIPRQVLLIDLNPILDFGPDHDWQSFSQPLDDVTSLDFAPATTTNVTSAPVKASPFASALAPRPGELPSSRGSASSSPVRSAARPVSQPVSRATAQPQAQPSLRTWDAPFPSLGQPQLDRQLRRYLTYLETVGQPDILIVGGQGAVQGVDPLALQESLGDRGYSNLKVFNWGLPDSSAQTVEWLLTELLTPQQLPKLVVWAETSVALNNGRQDSALGKIKTSPGQRLLARGLRPKIVEQEKVLTRQLKEVLSHPVPRALPVSVISLARSPLDWSSAASVQTNLKAQTKAQTKPVIDKPRQSTTAAAEPAASGVVAQTAPIVVDARSQVLPILKPRQSKPVAPAATDSSTNPSNSPAAQSKASGFRLVNWCRDTSGPCQTQDGQSPALAKPAAPAWLRQVEAAQEAKQRALRSPQRLAPRKQTGRTAVRPAHQNPSAVPTSTNTAALALPDWPQNPAAKQLLQAMGFQSVDSQLSSHQSSKNLSLRGNQDRDYRNFSLQGDQNRALHRLVQFGQEQGVAIAFVQLPLSQQYLDIDRYRHEQSFRTYLDVAAQMTPLNIVELPGDGLFWNDALFAKPNRLNRYGAAALGWQIGQAMDQTLLRTVQ